MYRKVTTDRTGDFVFLIGDLASVPSACRVGITEIWRSDVIASGSNFGARFIAQLKIPECHVVLRDSENADSPITTIPFSFQFMVLTDNDNPERKKVGEFFKRLPQVQVLPKKKTVHFQEEKKD